MAVIIFGELSLPSLLKPKLITFYFYHRQEERPGHHVKLYEYCSADIRDIVQRHLRVRPRVCCITPSSHFNQHDGEKDHRGPADFSGNATKADDIGDDNEDEVEEDDDVPSRTKRGRDGKLKPSSGMSGAAVSLVTISQ